MKNKIDAYMLNTEDEAALLEAIAEADRGDLLDVNNVLDQLPMSVFRGSVSEPRQ